MTSFVSKMNVKMDKKETHTSLGFFKVDLEAKVGIDNRLISPTIDPSVWTGIEIGETTTTAETITGPTIGTNLETIIDVTIGEIAISLMKDGLTIDRTIEEENFRQNIRNRQNYRGNDSQQRYMDRRESRDRSRNYSSNNSRGRDRNRDGQVQQRVRTLSDDRERSRSRSRSNSSVSTNRDKLGCFRCGEYDHFAQECPNTPTDDEMCHSDTEQASLWMLTHDNLPLNSNGEVEYLNL